MLIVLYIPLSSKLSPFAWRLSWLLAVILVTLWLVGMGHASGPIVVNSTEDTKKNDGQCTLREAIIAANTDKRSGGKPGECVAGDGADTIILPAGAYLLTRSDSGKEDAAETGDLDIAGDLAVVGGPGVTIDAVAFSDRVFHILSGNVTISGVTARNGNVRGDGGGIYNGGILTLENVALSSNAASGTGGGIYNAPSATLVMTNGTISGNSATGDGGGILNAGTLTLHNVTISGNEAGLGGGIVNNGGTVNFRNTIVAGNVAISASDCSGTLSSLGHNLVQDTLGCTIGGDVTGNIIGPDPLLGLLQDNGGGTLTHALLSGSPAIDAAAPTCPPPYTDQRGVSRPRGLACDIGAFEVEDPPQTSPIVAVNTSDDTDDGLCSFDHCSLREAINAANAHPNGSTPDEIHFNITIPAGGTPIIELTSALPVITGPVVTDGTTQPDSGVVVLDGNNAGAGVNGLTITAGGSTVRGLVIVNFGNGILLDQNDNNVIQGNTIADNSGDGIRILFGSTGNAILGNDIHDNGGLGIDLGGDGPTPNDKGDADVGANFVQNFPALFRAVPDVSSLTTRIEGRLNSITNMTFTLEFFASETCYPGVGGSQTFLGSASVTTGDSGDVYFRTVVGSVATEGSFVVATATDLNGNTSELSPCISVGPDNDSWPRALRLLLEGDPPLASVEQYIDQLGRSRWYKFEVQPNSTVIISLTNLSANYDLTFYKDVAAAYEALTAPQDLEDLVHLSAEFAPSAFSPSAFSPSAFSPSAFSPSAFSPSAFSPSAFSPSAFSPSAFSPSAFSPSAFSPSAFSPSAFSPSAFSPSAFSPSAFSPSAFSSAQARSLIGVSAFEGTASEGLLLKTWNNTGDFYVRVRGREGAFSLAAPFRLAVTLLPGPCGSVSADDLPDTSLTASGGSYETIILTDLGRMAGSEAEKSALQARLATLAGRPEVKGVVVDVGADARVATANAQAVVYFECPYAKNLVADAIKRIVDRYWDLNPSLQYVVIVGNDDVIPFPRYPDTALLGHESNYVPPVFDLTASQASLRLGYVLSQDAYGAPFDVSINANAFPIPDLAVGRLVETPADINTMLDAYLSTDGGVVPTPTSALVTGYDFLEDAAVAIQAELEAGIGADADALIEPRDLSPTDPAAWTADDLRALLLNNRYDLAFLAGHFSANSALAADYRTSLLTTDLVGSDVDMANAVFFSAGCHSGYNIVNEHGIPGITFQPDWAQAFAQKGATLIAGTGYQYGDTEFIEYSERLYLEFSRQLRTGSGPVSIGKALVAAKQAYLASTPQMRGIHEKALLEAVIFGLPMLSVDMPGDRLPPPSDTSIVGGTTPFTVDPGDWLGLEYADITLTPSLDLHPLELKNVDDGTLVTAYYLSGSDGIVTNPAEPVLPLEVENVTVPGMVLRGVGFRGGSFTDKPDVLPLTGAATTEMRGVHSPFLSDVFFPIRPWNLNYFDALTDPIDGITRLVVTPAQHKSSYPGSQTSTLRQFNSMNFRLYYSSNTDTFAGGSTPALADAPTIVRVSAAPVDGNVVFAINVVGNPAAGVQEVWVTYSATSGPFAGQWQSIDLTQSEIDSTLWEGTLSIGASDPCHIRYMVQAVNGVGLVGLVTNLGAYYTSCAESASPLPTEISLEVPDPSGPFSSRATFSAVLTGNGQPLAGQIVNFGLGAESRQAVTDSDGRATATIPLLGRPGKYVVRASFARTVQYAPSSDTGLFEIVKQGTVLSLDPPSATGYRRDESLMVATLQDAAGRRLSEQTVFFLVTGAGGSYEVSVIADYAGRAVLGNVSLLPGTYSVEAYFNGTVPLSAGSITLDDPSYLPSTATGSLTLVNDVPVAGDDMYSTAEDTTLTVAAPGVLTNDSDGDGDPLTVILVDGPISGTLDLEASGAFTYVPSADFNGLDTFTYRVDDGFDPSNTATVTITVNPVSDPPVANDDLVDTPEDTAVGIDVATNDFDVDSDLDPASATVLGAPMHGELIDNGDGSFTYTPDLNFYGSDGFTYEICDAEGLCDQAAVTINITPVNDAPVANDDTASTDEDMPVTIPVLDNDGDIDGDDLTVTGVSDPANGMATVNPDETVTYVPDPNYFGENSFTYTVCDGGGLCDAATVTVTVGALNDPPVAADDSYSVDEDVTLFVGVLDGVRANDSDVDGDPLTTTLVTSPTNGTLALNVDGSFIYTPAADFNGSDSFTYQICDPDNMCDTATVTITVNSVNDPPDCSAAAPTVITLWPPDKGFYPVSVYDVTDPDGDPTTITITITRIYQDEPVGKGKSKPDGQIDGSIAYVRAERDGGGDGRVYHVKFEATDSYGGFCWGVVQVGIVPHDQGGDLDAIDSYPPYYDSITGDEFLLEE